MKNKKKKPKNRRESLKYPALDPTFNLKSRFEVIDYDYLDELSEKEKAWLNNFTEEYTNANFKHKGKRVHKNDTVVKTVKTTGRKRKIDLAKQEAEHRNNARNRCVLTKAKASGMYVEKDALDPAQLIKDDPETEIINQLDLDVLHDFDYGSDESGNE